jgi:hypothetical protein
MSGSKEQEERGYSGVSTASFWIRVYAEVLLSTGIFESLGSRKREVLLCWE